MQKIMKLLLYKTSKLFSHGGGGGGGGGAINVNV